MENSSNKILLSFIIPVYNVEVYLQECVDSILAKLTDDCEIILVDDGSLDLSGEICDQYTRRDPRVHVIHKENGGLSSARNEGLFVAQGEYVTFVDSDDKIYSDSIGDLLQWIREEGADICFLYAEKFYPDGVQSDLEEGIERAELHLQRREDAIRHLASRPKYPGSAWAKLLKRELLIRNNLHFPYDRRYSEDLGYIRDCIMSAESYDCLDIPYYQYRQKRQGSITNQFTGRNFYDLLKFIIESVEMLTDDRKTNNYINKMVMSFVAYEYAVLLYVYNHIPAAERKEALKKLKEYKWVLRYSGNVKTKLISMVSNLLGVQFAAFCVGRIGKVIRK